MRMPSLLPHFLLNLTLLSRCSLCYLDGSITQPANSNGHTYCRILETKKQEQSLHIKLALKYRESFIILITIIRKRRIPMKKDQIISLTETLNVKLDIFICGPSYGDSNKKHLIPNCGYMPAGAFYANCQQSLEQKSSCWTRNISRRILPCLCLCMDLEATKKRRNFCGTI